MKKLLMTLLMLGLAAANLSAAAPRSGQEKSGSKPQVSQEALSERTGDSCRAVPFSSQPEELSDLKNALCSVDPNAQLEQKGDQSGVAFCFAPGLRGFAQVRAGHARLAWWYDQKISVADGEKIANEWNSCADGGRAWVETIDGGCRFWLATDAAIHQPIDLKAVVKLMGASALLSAQTVDFKGYVDQAVKAGH